MAKHLSDSDEQRQAELALIAALSLKLGYRLAPTPMRTGDGVTVRVDGVNLEHSTICEAYAHIGKTKGGQPAKLAKDILKLLAVERANGGTWRKIICLADADAVSCLRGRSWLAAAVTTFGIQVEVVELPAAIRQQVVEAQRRQIMINPSTADGT
jgi:hypothetical protein